jgi:hypothetical protein
MRSIAIMIALFLALALAVPAAAQTVALPSGPMCGPPPDTTYFQLDLSQAVGRFPQDATLDSMWLKLGGGRRGCHITNHPDTWLVQMTWLHFGGVPGIHHPREADAIQRRYAVPDTAQVDMLLYYYAVRGRTRAEAAAQAKKLEPRKAPPELLAEHPEWTGK